MTEAVHHHSIFKTPSPNRLVFAARKKLIFVNFDTLNDIVMSHCEKLGVSAHVPNLNSLIVRTAYNCKTVSINRIDFSQVFENLKKTLTVIYCGKLANLWMSIIV